MALHDTEVEARAGGSGVLPQNSGLVSTPVKEREDLKKAKYSSLLSLLKLLKVIGRREVNPTFFAPSFSSSEEFSVKGGGRSVVFGCDS